jgi:integrase
VQAFFGAPADPPQVVGACAYTKNGDPATLPLHASVLPLLRKKLAGLAPDELLSPGLAGKGGKDAAKMIQPDMADAGIPRRTANGWRSLHSCRNTFITGLFDAGVDAATAQKLARHATAPLTLSYARLRPDSERLAVAKLALPEPPGA